MTNDFNTNSEYSDQYQIELQFMLSGTGAQTLADSLAAAAKAGQKDTDYDIVDLSGDDLSKVVSLLGEDAFVKLDKSKIPNAASVEAVSASRPTIASRTAAPRSSLRMTPKRSRLHPRRWTSWSNG